MKGQLGDEMTTRDRTRSIVVAFPAGRGVPRWRERHAQSPVPSAWPYGLDRLAADGRVVTDLELGPPSRFRRLALAGRMTGRGRHEPSADVALCWDESTAERLLARRPGRRLFSGVIWVTDRLATDPAAAHSAQRTVLASLDGLWCLSRPQVDEVRAWLGSDAPPVHHLPFGIDEEFYAFAEYPGRPRVVSIGGDRDRDPATLFAALELVRRSRPDVECIVQSKSPLPAPAGVQKIDSVPHAEARAMYASASVVAVATRPNLHASGMTVALEAMSVGRPVVACATPGMGDYVPDGVTGALVAPGDHVSMAARILELLSDREAAEAMGRRGREHVVQAHTTTTMCRRLVEIVG